MLLVLGLGCLVYILGGVFSLQEGFESLGDLWGPMVFHAVTMALGSFYIGKAASAKKAAAGL